MILDGQQRLTSLFQALGSDRPVETTDTRGKRLKRWYYVDIRAAAADDADIEEAIRSIPEDKVIRDDFGRTVVADYSTVDKECSAEMFPLALAFHMPSVFAWQNRYLQIGQDEAAARAERWNVFYTRVLDNFVQYTVPTIVLAKDTPKDAVCTVFEKVNTGGVPLNVFELLTAMFAADGFRLKKDWDDRRTLLTKRPVLKELESADFLQAIALLATRDRRRAFVDSGREGVPPGIGCKRKDILDLSVSDYQTRADEVTAAFTWAAEFLNQESIFAARDVPYRTQIVPLAVIRAVLGNKAAFHGVRERIKRWYWSGVLGELYGGSTETRFARDVEQVPDWADDAAKPVPITVADASFREQRLMTLRTRNSAAYKGIYALLMATGAKDWLKHEEMGLANFFDYQVDIHHIFPKAWCAKNGVDEARRESAVNKTAISRHTNILIGGRAPKAYLATLEEKGGVDATFLDSVVSTHAIDTATMRANNFDAFFNDRRERLLGMIEGAMGTPVLRDVTGVPDDVFDEEPIEEDDAETDLLPDDLSSQGTMPTVTR